jgi:hypothetical protein
MMNGVVSSMICNEFRKEFQKRGDKSWQMSDPERAMRVRFSLKLDYDVEEGYRHLDLLIFGAGSNYITVMAKLDWAVIRTEWLGDDGDGLLEGFDYIEGSTPWVHYSNHDSCWTSDGVERIINEFANRINCLDSRYDSWYFIDTLTPEQVEEFHEITRKSRANGTKTKFQDIEFKFEKVAE